MEYPLLTNSLVNLIVGLALLAAWRRHRDQAFLKALGGSCLALVATPPGYLWWQATQGLAAVPAGALLVAAAVGHLLLLAMGAAGLAGRPLTRRQLQWLAALLLAIYLALLPTNIQVAHGVTTVLNLAVGGAAARWLWPQRGAERLSGVLLVAIALNRLWFVFLGESGVALQASVGTVLRAALGLALLYAALRRSGDTSLRLHDQYLRMTENLHFGVIVIQDDRVPYANRAAHRIYNLPAGRHFPLPWLSRNVGPADRERALARHRAIVSGEMEQAQWEGPRSRHDGRPMYLRFAAWRIEWDGQPAEQVVVMDDTEHHDATAALLYQATHDGLTGLPNRSALLQRLGDLCSHGSPFGLLLLDVDRFKLFNQAHGPSMGDEVLCALAQVLKQSIEAPAEAMRLGADEFALLLPVPQGDAEAASLALAGHLRDRLQQPLQLPSHEFYIDVSIGLALHPHSGREPEALLRSAHAAMTEAKRTPGWSLQRAEERFERGSGASLEAEQALRTGLLNEEFLLVYQPKVDARDGSLVGFEALVRWQRPGAGLVSPAEFIPAAERTGLIGSLGALIMDQACAQIAAWQVAGAGLVPVAVNVSPLQLLDPGFPGLVARTMARHGVEARWLTIEITETAAAMHLDQARQRLGEMCALGLQVALDDFGAGVSSLNILRSLPLQTVKIDRLLIDPMPAADAVAVVRAICKLAQALNLRVVAEGVETEAQAEAARDAGCDELQGYFFSRPLAVADASHWLARQPALVGAPT
ncbi:MAG: GGDEF domain-containing protein [Vitreoscilla sp.]|nr:GGDEF domain-containing protein [Vitreoscilla sp.]